MITVKNILSIYPSIAAVAAVCVAAASAQVYELTEQSFDNPEFRKKFIQGYLVGSETSPSINSDEKATLDSVAPLISTDPDGAIQRLRAYVNPNTSAAFDYMLGSLLDQKGESDLAVASYDDAIEKLPNYYQAYYNAGRSLTVAGNYSDGVGYLQKALAIKPGDGSLYGLIGYCYLNDGKYSTAYDAYTMAIMLEPKSKDWKLGKLSCLIELNRPEEAIALLYEFIDAEPDNADWWKMQANQFLVIEEPAKAASNLTIVKDMGSADNSSLMLLGDILVNKGIFDAALEAYDSALGTSGAKPESIIRVVENLILMEEPAYASELLANAEMKLKLSESDYALDILNQKAQIAMIMEEPDTAIGYLEDIVGIDPMNGRALLSLSKFHNDAGDLTKAEFYAESAVELEDFSHSACLSLAQIKVRQRNYAEAAKFLRRAQNIDPRPYVAEYLVKIEQAALRM